MKKHWLIYLLVALFCMACGNEQGDRARVSGTITGLADDTLIVYGADLMFDHVDTIYVKKGKFDRYISVDTTAQTWVMFKDGSRIPLFLSKRSNIKIKGDTTHLHRLQIEDKDNNHLLTQFLNEHDSTLTLALVDSFVSQHPYSPVGFYLINKYLLETNPSERKQITPLLEKFDEEMKHHPQYLNISERLVQEAKADTGHVVNYFRLKDINNKWVSRNEFTKKWLLINFWASWNDESKLQNSTLYKPLYKEIKKEKIEDFAMWGISLDVDREQWRKAAMKDTLEWTQSCDAKAWLSDVVKLFDIRNLPANVLITPNGRIKAYNLTKQQLEDKLKELKEEQKEKKKKK
ncbi:MAG: DUF4369 domain-containing protein [Bacteroidaceae bacterium]|nr:DUF4369 domain-containing protein [Bacteroidaceae bacterium]